MMDAQAREIVAAMQAQAMPRDTRRWLARYRASLETVVAMQGPAPLIDVSDDVVEGAGDSRVGLRLYRPPVAEPPVARPTDDRRPTLLFLHGGGFVGGTLEGYDIPLRWLALRSGWQIASVAYGLAPERPFPTAPDDCMAALRALIERPAIGADPNRIAVGGDSAGGLLATVVARRARDSGIPLALQILLYPNTDLRADVRYASRLTCDGLVIHMDELRRSLDLYLDDADRAHPDVSPLLAPDLAGLCPAFLVTNEYDPLRDEGEAYGDRLRAAGVPVMSQREEGMIHTAFQRGARIDRGDALITRVASVLRTTASAVRPLEPPAPSTDR